MDRPTESIIRDIIQKELGLSDNNIWISSQNKVIPNDSEELFAIVGLSDAVPMSNNSRVDFSDEPAVPQQIQELQVRENIQVEILSRNDLAFRQRWLVLSALTSTYAKQVQEENSFKLGRISTSFVNTSETDGAEQLNRFSIVIPCIVWYRNIVEVSTDEYFETFPFRADTEKTIDLDNGLIEIPNLAVEPDILK
jgi:hypothetical protein